MRPDFFDTRPFERPVFFVLKDINTCSMARYLACTSGPSVSQFRFTSDPKDAKRFSSHHEIFWYISEANADICKARDFNGRRSFEIVKVAEVEVITTEWKEVQ